MTANLKKVDIVNELTYLKTRLTSNQKHTIDSQTQGIKLKTYYNRKPSSQKVKNTNRKEQRKNIKSTGKQGLNTYLS